MQNIVINSSNLKPVNQYFLIDPIEKPKSTTTGFQLSTGQDNESVPCVGTILTVPHYSWFRKIVRWFQGKYQYNPGEIVMLIRYSLTKVIHNDSESSDKMFYFCEESDILSLVK